MFRRENQTDVLVTRAQVDGKDRPMKNILVTGGCGFIASNFLVEFMLNPKHEGINVFNLDIMDYCANQRNCEEIEHLDTYHFVRGDLGDSHLVMYLMQHHDIDTVIHFAAQSHVDNSFGNSMEFTKHNVLGTHNLLECARKWGKIAKFIHVSTDEVYGEVTASQTEAGMLNPTNPYAATKAAAEFIVKSYTLSFGLPCIITRGNNVYGRFQYPEKVIPRFLMLATQGKKLTIQGTGQNTRTFIHASDVARAFVCIVDSGIIGEVYNIGCRDEHSVLEIASRVIKFVHPTKKPEEMLDFVPDRDFNDQRYDIDSSKLMALGWKKQIEFDEGFEMTAKWYAEAFKRGHWDYVRIDIATAAAPVPAASPVVAFPKE